MYTYRMLPTVVRTHIDCYLQEYVHLSNITYCSTYTYRVLPTVVLHISNVTYCNTYTYRMLPTVVRTHIECYLP
jgi:hypothetical protein